MNYRSLGKTGFEVSEISLGTWQVGGKWGSKFDHSLADSVIREAIDRGVNFIDTADVYSEGESEIAVGKAVRESGVKVRVATKCGRQINPHVNKGYTSAVLRGYVEDSLRRMGTDCLDLIQLHCPPTEVYYRPEVFGILDDFVAAGKLRHYGVSVEKVEEAVKAVEFPGVQSVQIIFNIFRQRPADLFFTEAKRRKVGILARLPLSSGMLAGKMTRTAQFAPDDHRLGNRQGEWFDRGETFSGVDFETGLEAVEALRPLIPPGVSMAQFAMRWILEFDAVTCAIPGAKRPAQAEENIAAADLPPLNPETMRAVRAIYEQRIQPLVHHYW